MLLGVIAWTVAGGGPRAESYRDPHNADSSCIVASLTDHANDRHPPPAVQRPWLNLTAEEIRDAYGCVKTELIRNYDAAGISSIRGWAHWQQFAKRPFLSAANDDRLVLNYANDRGAGVYGRFEDITAMPAGSVLAKPSFRLRTDGRVMIGPMFAMEKMPRGWNPETADWRYTKIDPYGSLVGTTRGEGHAEVKFCHGCHVIGADTDYTMLVPHAYRKKDASRQ